MNRHQREQARLMRRWMPFVESGEVSKRDVREMLQRHTLSDPTPDEIEVACRGLSGRKMAEESWQKPYTFPHFPRGFSIHHARSLLVDDHAKEQPYWGTEFEIERDWDFLLGENHG